MSYMIYITDYSKLKKKNLRSAFVAGGFLVAQFVRIALDPNH